MTAPRFADWQARLEAFWRDRQSMPFAWGSNDCALFAADAVEALTGQRVCEAQRGYRDARGALRVLAAVGGVHGLATAGLGEPIAPMLARVGDVVAVRVGKREALGICNGSTVLGAAAQGIAAVSTMTQALAAWRVG